MLDVKRRRPKNIEGGLKAGIGGLSKRHGCQAIYQNQKVTPPKSSKSKSNRSNSTVSPPTSIAIMPKSAQKKGNGSRSTPYSPASAAKAKAANNIFKMNTDLGYLSQPTQLQSHKANVPPKVNISSKTPASPTQSSKKPS
jgi:hypothetical protein